MWPYPRGLEITNRYYPRTNRPKLTESSMDFQSTNRQNLQALLHQYIKPERLVIRLQWLIASQQQQCPHTTTACDATVTVKGLAVASGVTGASIALNQAALCCYSSGRHHTGLYSQCYSPTRECRRLEHRFSWSDVGDATLYRLHENSDGISGFSQVGGDILSGVQTVDLSVPLFERTNASYMLWSRNDTGCNDDSLVSIGSDLLQAVGYFKASNTGVTDNFGGAGISLSQDGNTLAVAADFEDSNSNIINSGEANDSAIAACAVYMFINNNGAWEQQAYIKAVNAGAEYLFDEAISLSDDGNTLAVGAFDEDSSTTGINNPTPDDNLPDSGAAYVFTRTASIWSQQAFIKGSDLSESDIFGSDLSLSSDGNQLAVGSRFGNNLQGSAYLFSPIQGNWSELSTLGASNPQQTDSFGGRVEISGDGMAIAIGASEEDSTTNTVNGIPNEGGNGNGAVYLY
jgi:hypothetical protein